MKRNEVLRYPLADIGPESPVMTVRLHRTPSGYWRFDVRYNHQIDIADRLFNSLAELEDRIGRNLCIEVRAGGNRRNASVVGGDAGTAGHEKRNAEASGGKEKRLFHDISFHFFVGEIKANTILTLSRTTIS